MVPIFILDSSFVGTIFVNSLANFVRIIAKQVESAIKLNTDSKNNAFDDYTVLKIKLVHVMAIVKILRKESKSNVDND